MDLVILAAGMGSRFGGAKQVEPVDDEGRFIIDYSIRDAIAAGFDHIILIIREKDHELFKNTVGKRIPKGIKVDYVFQEMQTIPDVRIPAERTKPLGTAHAVLCCKDVIQDQFLVINADDYYGPGSYRLAIEFKCTDDCYGCITYKAGNTLTENGSVKRGVCCVSNGCITKIDESSLQQSDSKIEVNPLNGDESYFTEMETPVSMNMFVLPRCFVNILSVEFNKFVSQMSDFIKDEYLLPDIVNKLIASNQITLKNITSDDKWYGITYREDLKSIKVYILNKQKDSFDTCSKSE